jgi:hypothetical protein
MRFVLIKSCNLFGIKIYSNVLNNIRAMISAVNHIKGDILTTIPE